MKSEERGDKAFAPAVTARFAATVRQGASTVLAHCTGRASTKCRAGWSTRTLDKAPSEKW